MRIPPTLTLDISDARAARRDTAASLPVARPASQGSDAVAEDVTRSSRIERVDLRQLQDVPPVNRRAIGAYLETSNLGSPDKFIGLSINV